MLDPDYLSKLPNDLIELYYGLEEEILKDIADRLKKTYDLDNQAQGKIQFLLDNSYSIGEVEEKLEPFLEDIEIELDHIIEKAGLKHYRSEQQAYSLVDKRLEDIGSNSVIQKQMDIARTKLLQDNGSITKSMGFAYDGKSYSLHDFYTKELNKHIILASSGAYDYQSTVRGLVHKLSQSGVKSINYMDSGRNYTLEAAAKMIVRTTINQMSMQMSLINAETMEQDLMEITAHMGARPSHQLWQGKIVSLSGKSGYLSLDDIGYGDVRGFGGANCRHNWYPFFEGISERAYSDEDLKNIDPGPFEFNGKKYSYYEATQKQRQIERSIRKYKNQVMMYDKIGDEEAKLVSQVRLRLQRDLYKDFNKAGGLKPSPLNLYKEGYGRSENASISPIIKEISNKNWTMNFKNRVIKSYNYFYSKGIKTSVHFLSRFEQRKESKNYIIVNEVDVLNAISRGANFYQTQDSRLVYFDKDNQFALFQNNSNNEFISFVRRKTEKKEGWVPYDKKDN